jgi:guanine nucleotide exchange factor
MSNHVPSSSSVCIHSICVDPARRGKRIGARLLAEYVVRLEARGTYERILLISHAELRRFYELAGGFEWLGKSTVVHGPREWYEMRRTVNSQTSPVSPPPTEIPPGLLEALQRPSRKNETSSRLIAAFPNGIEDVILTSPSSPKPTNRYDLMCPRPNCGSVILKSDVAAFAERPSVQVLSPSFPVKS